jgi:hypothetical protein
MTLCRSRQLTIPNKLDCSGSGLVVELGVITLQAGVEMQGKGHQLAEVRFGGATHHDLTLLPRESRTVVPGEPIERAFDRRTVVSITNTDPTNTDKIGDFLRLIQPPLLVDRIWTGIAPRFRSRYVKLLPIPPSLEARPAPRVAATGA